MDRRRLASFVALAEELHFGRAAIRSGISQPGLSQQLRQLEAQLQVKLLHRSKRHVSLTETGQVFLAEARRILKDMASAIEVTRQTEEGRLGTLKLGTTPSALFIMLPEILLRFQRLLPQVQVDVRQMLTEEQAHALRAGDIHVGLLHPPLDDRSLVHQTIRELPFKIVLSSENPLSERPVLTLADLAHETFIMFPRGVGTQLYDQIIALCHREGFSPRKILETSPAQSIVAMAACNLGIGFVASEVQQYDRPHAVFRTIAGPAPSLKTAVAYSPHALVPMARQFISVAAEAAAEVR